MRSIGAVKEVHSIKYTPFLVFERPNKFSKKRQKNSWNFVYILAKQCRSPFNLTNFFLQKSLAFGTPLCGYFGVVRKVQSTVFEVMVSNTAWKSGYSSANDYKEATHRIRCHRRLLIGGKCLPGYDYRTIGSASKLHHCHAHHRDSNKRPRPQYHVTKTE